MVRMMYGSCNELEMQRLGSLDGTELERCTMILWCSRE